MSDPKKQLAETCEQIARQELANRGWGLVRDWNGFIEEVINEAEKRLKQGGRRLSEKKIISNATVNRYAHLWHHACGADGTFWQHQAFEELHLYLYRIAYQMCHNPDLAEQSTQTALINVWQYLKKVNEPGSFPRWAGMIVTREVLKLVSREEREMPLPDEGDEGDDSSIPDGILDNLIIWPNRLKKLEEVIRGCLRSKERQAVIFEILFKDKTLPEVAEALNKTLTAVYSLKSKALLQLRECQTLLTFVKKIGISLKGEHS